MPDRLTFIGERGNDNLSNVRRDVSHLIVDSSVKKILGGTRF
jgi:hypothetical protein